MIPIGTSQADIDNHKRKLAFITEYKELVNKHSLCVILADIAGIYDNIDDIPDEQRMQFVCADTTNNLEGLVEMMHELEINPVVTIDPAYIELDEENDNEC